MEQTLELLSLYDISSIFYEQRSAIITSIRSYIHRYKRRIQLHALISLSKQLVFIVTNIHIPSSERLMPEMIQITVNPIPSINLFTTIIAELAEREMIMSKEINVRNKDVEDLHLQIDKQSKEITELQKQLKEFNEIKKAKVNSKQQESCFQIIPKSKKFDIHKTLREQLIQMGVGGLSEQIEVIEKQIFIPLKDREYAQKIKATRAKGLLLYGPPGCGKSFVAGKIAGLISDVDIILVSGPSLKNMWVGGSEENVRKIFEADEKDTNKNNIHVIVIDECDSLFSKRELSSASRHDNGIVNQFLSKMDGVMKDVANILIIGTTNRIDMIDEAIKRPGRMELNLEVKQPDFNGLKDLLNIYMKDAKSKMIYKLSGEEENKILNEMFKRKFSCAGVKGLCDKVKNESVTRHHRTGIETINYSDFINAM